MHKPIERYNFQLTSFDGKFFKLKNNAMLNY